VTFFLRFAASSDVGRVRRDNQDSGYVGPNLLVVADGVGGAARGDIASSATVEVLRKLDVPAGNDALSELAATIHLAHDRLAEIVEAHPDLDGTSTTVTAAVFDGTHLRIGHVGDSRAYLLRDGDLQQLTSDHSLVQSLVDEGRITEAEARVHPHRNLILKAVDSVHEPEPDLFSVPLQVGDRLLFCSDGCSGVLESPSIAALLAGEPLESVTASLVRAALEAGSSDNVTVVVASVDVVVAGSSPEPANPVVVGAAASKPHLQIGDEETGNLTDSDLHVLAQADVDPEAIRYAPLPPPSRLWLRRLIAALVVLALIGSAGFGAYKYSQTRYYLSVNGNGQVVINQGVDFGLPLIGMHHAEPPLLGYTSSNLGQAYGNIKNNHPSFGSKKDAQAYLVNAFCTALSPPSTPTDTPTGIPTPTKLPTKGTTGKPATKSKKTQPTSTKTTAAPSTLKPTPAAPATTPAPSKPTSTPPAGVGAASTCSKTR
jgi:serine/threonine protein phosphatase PrpC